MDFYGVPRGPIPLQSCVDVNMKMDELIDVARGGWKKQRLQELFPADEVTYILSYPPAPSCADDYIWPFTKNGTYTVRSGRSILVMLKQCKYLQLVKKKKSSTNLKENTGKSK